MELPPVSGSHPIIMPPLRWRGWIGFVIILILFITSYVVYALGGGSQTPYIHFLYLPIILIGLIFGVQWGGAAGVFVGLLLGPFLPEDMEQYAPQETLFWMIRLVVFTIVGVFCGWVGGIYRNTISTLSNFSKIHPLSGLPNFSGMEAYFESSLHQQSTMQPRCVVIQLGHLDEIKQSFGFEVMYQLVRQMGEGLKKLKPLGHAGHLDTRHFVMLLDQTTDIAYLMDSCEDIVREAIRCQDISVFTELRYGVSKYPTDDTTWSGLSRKAFLAIEAAEDQGKKIEYYVESFEEEPRQNLQLLHSLNQTFYRNQLDLFFQPQLALTSRQLTGADVILRWNHPEFGIVPTEQFMPLAGKTLLIDSLTRWTLDNAFKTLSTWIQEGFQLRLSFKLSMSQLQDKALQETLHLFLTKHNLPPHTIQICLEDLFLNERHFPFETLVQRLHDLKSLGLKIAIDNMGYKAFSYRYLLELPLDTLKISPQLIHQVQADNLPGKVVQHIISLGNQLEIEVVAQGVESLQQETLLKAWGCHAIQGYLVSIPLSQSSFFAWLRSKQARV